MRAFNLEPDSDQLQRRLDVVITGGSSKPARFKPKQVPCIKGQWHDARRVFSDLNRELKNHKLDMPLAPGQKRMSSFSSYGYHHPQTTSTQF